MFWAASVLNELIGLFTVRQRVKIDSKNNCDSLECNFVPHGFKPD